MKLTDEQLALLPSDDDVKFYREHGFYLSKQIYTDEQIESALRGADRFYKGERDELVKAQDKFIPGWNASQGDVLRKNDYSSFQNRELFQFVRNPLVGAIAAKLSGSPTIRLWHDQLLWKPIDQPDKKANVGWHTDRGYWKTCTSTNLITAWVPFHDCDDAMGTITMIDGSHRWPDNTENLNFFSSDLEGLEKNFNTGGNAIKKIPANLKKGCVSFHHCLTIHGSGPNRSNQPRRSIAIHLQDETNRWQEHRRGDGSLAMHWNDRLCRKVDGKPDYTDPEVCPVLWK
jgi:ectoine hydroxylase-related dioxygenase (phytanoyl-CoA dioxygenase family)